MNSIWLLVGITALAGVGGTGMGGVVACMFRKDSDKTVSLLLSFAAGVMTAVVCFDLLTEALHADGETAAVWPVAFGVSMPGSTSRPTTRSRISTPITRARPTPSRS